MCFLHERSEVCAHHESEKRIVWVLVVLAGIAGLIWNPPKRDGASGETVAGVTSVSR
jgi:hypothetical protein